MKKILSILAIACGICLLASCQASEAVTRNLIKYNGYEYAIASASQHVVESSDTLESADGDTLGFSYLLVLNSPHINIDTVDFWDNDTIYSYPTDRKFAQLVTVINSPGLNGICPGEYKQRDALFFSLEDAAVVYDYDWTANGTKVITSDEFDDMISHASFDFLGYNETLTVKKGTLFYEIEFTSTTPSGEPIYAYYCGPIPLVPYLPIPLFFYLQS